MSKKLDDLERDIAAVINKHGLDSLINMPDYVIAQYMTTAVGALNTARHMNKKHKELDK